ncbi:MAG: NTP transferase domain-containing protein [Patescibacteria group bacterium]|nr:NTP transferase domain-containing protein [Patescibacteria group bacterium]
MQLLVLAAGVGKRIKPIVTSKPLLPFIGKTLLEWVVESASMLKPSQTVIVVNPKDKAKVAKLLPKAKLVVQAKPTGMAGAVLATRSNLVGPTVVINGDDWIAAEITQQFSGQIKATPQQVVLTGIRSQPGYSGGFFDLQGPTLKVVEKPQGKQPSQWAKVVLDYFPKIEKFVGALESIKSVTDDVYEQALNQLDDISLVKAAGSFCQLKYPWQVLDLAQFLLTSQLKGKALIDPTAKVFPGTYIINSYIGPKVIIGHNCLIRDSIIESGSVVGFNTEIARSYVGPDNFFHSNYIGDSVIESGSNFGAGAVLANFRFDHKPIGQTGRAKFGAVVGKGAQVGVNASVMPGVMIEAGAFIWPGAIKQ